LTRTVPALKFAFSPHRVALAVTAGRVRTDLIHGGTGSPLRHTEIPRPERPPGWVRIAPTLGGICASDRKMLKVTELGRPLLAFFGMPRHGVVPGHEVVGTVLEADADAGVQEGDRVVAEPTLACTHKGFAPCRRCAAGDDHRCVHQADAGGAAGPGFGFGFNARYGGGWAGELVAPAGHVHRVPDDLDDRSAVLAEPTAVAVHAVLRSLPEPGSRVAIVGPGAIGLGVLHALTTLAPEVETTVIGLGDFADDHARTGGATHLLHGTERELVEAAGRQLGSTVRGGMLAGPILEDGFDMVFDTVGFRQTMDDAVRMLRPGGTLVLLGTAAEQTLDWSLVWHRELTIRGSGYYGTEDVPPGAKVDAGRRRAFEVALEVLAEHRPSRLVTHVFPLDEPVPALETAARGPGAGAVKVAFSPQP
jgi:threonine dehydrogenase-like Zn-dependent dehydrogenase